MNFSRIFRKYIFGTRRIILFGLSTYLALFICLVFLHGIISNVITTLSVNPNDNLESLQSIKSANPRSHLELSNTKKILIWNSYWNSKAVWNKIFSKILLRQCPESQCELTTDASQLNASDAVLFHLVDLSRENYNFPVARHPDQIWIAFTYEPPHILQNFGLELKLLNDIFNRTMSYRLDGDVVVSYGSFHKLQHPFIVTTRHVSNWVDSTDSIDSRNYADRKTRLIAWFVSSHGCESESGREFYVKELQKYIPVDIYGDCGPYKCGIRRTMRYPYNVDEDDCYMMISVEYKFVLAFENSLCSDYVTEKLYNNLRLNAVPIVFGAGNYSALAPPYSVIDARKYKPKELANYLVQLDKDDKAYNKYFEWKQHYTVESSHMAPDPCHLCEQLHNPTWTSEKKVYMQFDEWILSGCQIGYGKK